MKVRGVSVIGLAVTVGALAAGGGAAAQTGGQAELLAAEEKPFLANVRQLTSRAMGLDKAGEAYFSPDGRRIAFQAFPAGKQEYQIYVCNQDGTGLQMVSGGAGATTCAYFHPDGTKMIFASNHLDPRPATLPDEIRKKAEQAGVRNYAWSFFPGMDIFEFTFETRQLKRLTDADGYDAEGSYSPDGKQIVFTSMRDGDQEIYMCDADGGSPRRITKSPGYDGGPFFSPDGRRIVYRSDRVGEGNMQIFVNTLDGAHEKALTGNDVLNWCPFWHPSGRTLIFTRADHRGRPNYDLYLVTEDGARQQRITFDAAFDGLPAFSADGKKLMWTSKRGGLADAQVFVADFTPPAGW